MKTMRAKQIRQTVNQKIKVYGVYQFAKDMGVTAQCVYRWLDIGYITPSNVPKASGLLNVDMGDLNQVFVCEEGNKKAEGLTRLSKVGA